MAGAYTALSDDVFGGLWNPAGLRQVKQQGAGFFYLRQFGLIPYLAATFVHPVQSSTWTHGEALLVSGDDAMRETILAFSMAVQLDRYIDNLTVGASLRYKNATFGNNMDGGIGQVRGNAVGFSLDVGLHYRLHERLRLGLMAENLLDVVSWNTSAKGSYGQPSPMGGKIGLAFLWPESWIVSMDLDKSFYRDTQDHLRFGIEKSLFSMLYLRSGLHTRLSPDSYLDYHLGLGISRITINQAQLSLDMAYVMDQLQNALRCSLTIEF